MTRAALLPAGSDPFLNAYWLRNYATWADQVDELHVAVCGPLEPDVLAYTESCVAAVPHARMIHIDHRTDHGATLSMLLDETQADHVMLCEDDAYIRRPEVIGECFAVAEAGGIAATPRGYGGNEATAAAAARFGPRATGNAFWPCFLFVAREHLLATDRQFGATIRLPGDYSAALDHTFSERDISDTFVSASYQLRAMGLDISLRDNYRLGDVQVPRDAPWFHVGSLSAGHGHGFMGSLGPDEYRVEVQAVRSLPPTFATGRVSWWQRAWSKHRWELADYGERYGRALQRFMVDIGVNQPEADAMRRSHTPLITWDE